MMFVNKKLFTTALLGLLVTLSIIALILSLVRVEDVTLPPTVQYGMVFDAGSSHTSLSTSGTRTSRTTPVWSARPCPVMSRGQAYQAMPMIPQKLVIP